MWAVLQRHSALLAACCHLNNMTGSGCFTSSSCRLPLLLQLLVQLSV
jgi:hypothetical protein